MAFIRRPISAEKLERSMHERPEDDYDRGLTDDERALLEQRRRERNKS